ncbi:hypothetical protein BJ912DRAFT_112956 [Pholiota molesta]|nr:hypothetical protein BJ912DRAFT_112956 [Pholiota molesta]
MTSTTASDSTSDTNASSPIQPAPAMVTVSESRIMGNTGLSKRRKKRIKAVAPNRSRCLVENCPKQRAVRYCHIVAKSLSNNDEFMNSIEWFWNMRRTTLNLNTRRNIVCLGASLQKLMDSGNWALLPSSEIIMQYASTLEQIGKFSLIADRKKFPDIPDGIYSYSLLPLFRMEKLGITIQTDRVPVGPESFVNYIYPFADLPAFRSHIHPKFAILALGRKLSEMVVNKARRKAFDEVLEKFPILEEVQGLYIAWTNPVDPKAVKADKSYAAPDYDSDDDEDSKPDIDDYDDDDSKDSDNKSTSSAKTKPRRVRDAKRERANTKKRKRASTSPTPGRRRHDNSLYRESLVEHERAVGKGGWTAEQFHPLNLYHHSNLRLTWYHPGKIYAILRAMIGSLQMSDCSNIRTLGPKGDNETSFIRFNIEGEVYHDLIPLSLRSKLTQMFE